MNDDNPSMPALSPDELATMFAEFGALRPAGQDAALDDGEERRVGLVDKVADLLQSLLANAAESVTDGGHAAQLDPLEDIPPHLMTLIEWLDARLGRGHRDPQEVQQATYEHREAVYEALDAGLYVAPNVLTGYPELLAQVVAQTADEQSPAETTLWSDDPLAEQLDDLEEAIDLDVVDTPALTPQPPRPRVTRPKQPPAPPEPQPAVQPGYNPGAMLTDDALAAMWGPGGNPFAAPPADGLPAPAPAIQAPSMTDTAAKPRVTPVPENAPEADVVPLVDVPVPAPDTGLDVSAVTGPQSSHPTESAPFAVMPPERTELGDPDYSLDNLMGMSDKELQDLYDQTSAQDQRGEYTPEHDAVAREMRERYAERLRVEHLPRQKPHPNTERRLQRQRERAERERQREQQLGGQAVLAPEVAAEVGSVTEVSRDAAEPRDADEVNDPNTRVSAPSHVSSSEIIPEVEINIAVPDQATTSIPGAAPQSPDQEPIPEPPAPPSLPPSTSPPSSRGPGPSGPGPSGPPRSPRPPAPPGSPPGGGGTPPLPPGGDEPPEDSGPSWWRRLLNLAFGADPSREDSAAETTEHPEDDLLADLLHEFGAAPDTAQRWAGRARRFGGRFTQGAAIGTATHGFDSGRYGGLASMGLGVEAGVPLGHLAAEAGQFVGNLPEWLSHANQRDVAEAGFGGAAAAGSAALATGVGFAVGGPAGAALGAVLGEAFEKLAMWSVKLVEGLHDFAENINTSNKALGEYNGKIAGSQMRLEMDRFRRDFETAGNTAGTASMLADAVSEMEDATQPFRNDLANLTNVLATLSAEIVGALGNLYSLGRGAAEVILDLSKKADEAGVVAGAAFRAAFPKLGLLGDVAKQVEAWLKKDDNRLPMGKAVVDAMHKQPVQQKRGDAVNPLWE